MSSLKPGIVDSQTADYDVTSPQILPNLRDWGVTQVETEKSSSAQADLAPRQSLNNKRQYHSHFILEIVCMKWVFRSIGYVNEKLKFVHWGTW